MSTTSEDMHPLDNVVWHSLNTRHAGWAESYDEARRFIPEISTLAGFMEPTERGYAALAELTEPGTMVNLALAAPLEAAPSGWSFVRGTPMPQMVYAGDRTALSASANGEEILELGTADAAEMMELTGLTKPGPFAPRTYELGTYLGIRRNGKLIAMAGERLKVPGYTEVSAICTHPEHTGRGYARILTTEIMRRILNRDEISFLHVRQDNRRAIELYERLGFRCRVVRYHAVLKRVKMA
jgi:ribosomal protein S18 acetylase RimI-like enzyme